MNYFSLNVCFEQDSDKFVAEKKNGNKKLKPVVSSINIYKHINHLKKADPKGEFFLHDYKYTFV